MQGGKSSKCLSINPCSRVKKHLQSQEKASFKVCESTLVTSEELYRAAACNGVHPPASTLLTLVTKSSTCHQQSSTQNALTKCTVQRLKYNRSERIPRSLWNRLEFHLGSSIDKHLNTLVRQMDTLQSYFGDLGNVDLCSEMQSIEPVWIYKLKICSVSQQKLRHFVGYVKHFQSMRITRTMLMFFSTTERISGV